VLVHSVGSVQLHDVRLVAAMHGRGMTRVPTLNDMGFRRYVSVIIAHPREFAKAP